MLTDHLSVGYVFWLVVFTEEEDNDEYTGGDLQVGDGDVPRPEEDRETLAAKNARLQKQLEVN